MIRTTALSTLVCLSLAACTTVSHSNTPQYESAWAVPSPALNRQIEAQAKRLPWTHGVTEMADLIAWFADVGEPAYPTLLNLVLDPRPEVAGAALAALGATRDARLVEHLHELPWPDDESPGLALERARALLSLGDWSMAPILIESLRDESVYRRALCIKALEGATRQRLGFVAGAKEEEREDAVRRWEAWWSARSNDPLLAQGGK